MAREPSIPLFLWVATAALAHILWGGGADQVAEVIEGRTTLSRFAQAIRGHVKGRNAPVEIALWDEEALEKAPPEPSQAGDTDQEQSPEDPEPDETAAKEEKTEIEKAEEELAREKPPPQPDKVVPPEKEKPKPDQPAEIVPAKPLQVDRRIAVRQTVEDKTQENKNAEFLGEDANRVEQQTQARITSTDQHEAKPELGESHAGPSDEAGNASLTDLAQSQDSAGDPEKAPSESEHEGLDKAEAAQARSPLNPNSRVFGESAAEAARRPVPKTPNAPSRGQQARASQSELEAAPETPNLAEGSFELSPEQEAQAAQKARKAIAESRTLPRDSRRRAPLTDLGTLQTTPGGINPNLNQLSAQSAIGQDRLQREKLADGERRRSKHRGSFKAVGLERWRSSIENYVAAVKPGNQTALNTARSPFANYLNHIHNRLHPEFAHAFLSSLDSLPRDHAMNRPDMKTHMEIVLSGEDGRVVQLGITRASGSTAFDVGALESVQGASPFGAPPSEIISPDGRVYLHWEFYRDPSYACSTYFAKPYILRVAPSSAPPAPKNPTPVTPQEHGEHQSSEPARPQQDG